MGYEYYFNRLHGVPSLAAVDSPQPGFFRDREGTPIAFFQRAEMSSVPSPDSPVIGVKVVRRKGGMEYVELSPEQAMDTWNWVCANPVEEGAWRLAAEGQAWPDEAPGLGHNQPPEAYETPETKAKRLIGLIDEWLEANPKIETQTVADQAAHYLTEARHTTTDLEVELKRALEPYRGFMDQVRTKFAGMLAPLDGSVVKIKLRLTPFLREKDRALQAEQQRQADERAKAKEEGRRPAAFTAAPTTARAGGTGKAATLRRRYTAEIVDYDRAVMAAKGDRRVREAVQSIANEWAREAKGDADKLLPGTNSVEEKRL